MRKPTIEGKYKYTCADCGKDRFLPYWAFSAKTKKTHCLGCGGTFFIPASGSSITRDKALSVTKTQAGVRLDGVGVGSERELLVTRKYRLSKKHKKALLEMELGSGSGLNANPAEPPLREEYSYVAPVKAIGKAKKKNERCNNANRL